MKIKSNEGIARLQIHPRPAPRLRYSRGKLQFPFPFLFFLASRFLNSLPIFFPFFRPPPLFAFFKFILQPFIEYDYDMRIQKIGTHLLPSAPLVFPIPLVPFSFSIPSLSPFSPPPLLFIYLIGNTYSGFWAREPQVES